MNILHETLVKLATFINMLRDLDGQFNEGHIKLSKAQLREMIGSMEAAVMMIRKSKERIGK